MSIGGVQVKEPSLGIEAARYVSKTRLQRECATNRGEKVYIQAIGLIVWRSAAFPSRSKMVTVLPSKLFQVSSNGLPAVREKPVSMVKEFGFAAAKATAVKRVVKRVVKRILIGAKRTIG